MDFSWVFSSSTFPPSLGQRLAQTPKLHSFLHNLFTLERVSPSDELANTTWENPPGRPYEGFCSRDFLWVSTGFFYLVALHKRSF